MSRKPYIPCAGECGNLLYPGRGSLPPGQMTCRPCRRARRPPRQELRSCATCGAEFRPGRGHGRHMTACSDPCAEIRQRNRYRAKCRARRARRASTWDGVTDEQILDRDGWRCGICTRKINRWARWPHPDSRSVDHIVPLSRGGDDTAANKQAAHLGCNMRKSDSTAGQLALFDGLVPNKPPNAAAPAAAVPQRQAPTPALAPTQLACPCGSTYLVTNRLCLACRLLGRGAA